MSEGLGNGTPAGAAEHQWVKWVMEQLWAGRTRLDVVQDLRERGIEAGKAARLVDDIMEELRRRGAL